MNTENSQEQTQTPKYKVGDVVFKKRLAYLQPVRTQKLFPMESKLKSK